MGPSVWLDGKDTNGRNNWIWYSTGVSVARYLWASDQPDNFQNTQEDCILLNVFRTDGFHDFPCSRTHNFVCEFDPVNGAWGFWKPWGSCSATCGQGLRTRTRVCNNPKPVGAGKPCPGDDRQTELCFPGQCPTCQVHNVPGAMSSVSVARINENEQVKYYCLPEHKLVGGSLVRTCQPDGTFTDEEPQCKKCCGMARFIVNGYPDTSASLCYGDHVNYLCDRGYKSSNSTPIVCSSPYEWKYIPLPNCEPTGDCKSNDLQAPQGGHKACTDLDQGKFCYMRCGDGQTYTGGSDVFECNAKTGWAWQVRVLGGADYMPSAVGRCQG
ncbi:thrombospondin-2-like [Lingula anatina]|uniref:Thrombospondin-2-like n=1 Tax=Lingula anatina TaxID=7574 RepID=A0A1S3H3T7_LINAN|nr:thrombospondin-2-like [Lingula anatina]|eukprot:XP_013380622.1 thrombospondin-2-like [Lingula anatina]